MPTKTTSTATNSYNQGSMDQFNQLQPQIGSTLTDFMKNPLQSSFYQQMLAQSNRQIQGRTNAQIHNIMNPAAGTQVSNPSAYADFQRGMIARGGNDQASQAGTGLLLGAQQLRQGALGQAMGYHPLQTGGTQTQTTGGLGTWLPQLAGAAIGAAGMGLTGGMSEMFGKLGGDMTQRISPTAERYSW